MAARVGEQSAVVWKRGYFNPCPARRSAFGVWHGPPNALDAPKPTSSSRMTRTFGAPAGGRRGFIGGNFVLGSLASYVVRPTGLRSGIGSPARPMVGAWARAGSSAEAAAIDVPARRMLRRLKALFVRRAPSGLSLMAYLFVGRGYFSTAIVTPTILPPNANGDL